MTRNEILTEIKQYFDIDELVCNHTLKKWGANAWQFLGDFTIQGRTAEQARQSIKNNAGLLPCNIRVEGGVTWLHFDVLPQAGITQKVYEFKA